MTPNLLASEFFEFEYSDQPHADRRQIILKSHPEIKKLMAARIDGLPMVLKATTLTLILLWMAYYVSIGTFSYFYGCVVGIFPGSVMMSWLFLAMHEAAHGLVFGPSYPMHNRIFGCAVNLPLVLPMYAFFRKHHKWHHKYLADFEYDLESPSETESWLFGQGSFPKFAFVVLQPISMLIRFIVTLDLRSMGKDEFYNFASMVLFMSGVAVMSTEDKPLFYGLAWLAFSVTFATGAGTVGLWTIGVHTAFYRQEDTNSYYGVMNNFYTNFGYHVEHHDFRNVPSIRLPQVREMAPEFYEENHHVNSLLVTLIKFVHEPDVTIKSARSKRVIPQLHPNTGWARKTY